MSTAPASPERKTIPIMTPDSHRGGRGTATSTNNNIHPYAIRTTSTALLTRSNSSGFVSSHQHVYVPTTPSPSPSKHRYSKSDLTLARPSPRPLPIPPQFDSPTKPSRGSAQNTQVFPPRTRAETLPAAPNPPLPSPVKVDDLPSNPRVWTTSQLASYLVTALRVRHGEALPLPLPVAKDVASFVKQERLTGRAFLRLTIEDLEQMEINNLWRDALLNASRNLRANVLKGRIWGFGTEDANEPSPIYPFRSRYNSSSSSIDELSAGSQDKTPQKDAPNKGRVRRAIASLERTSSYESGFSNRGSSTSDGEVVHGAFSDDEASFASGSESSEIDLSRTRNVTKKRILPQPPILVDEATPADPAEIVKPDEPSVEELLESDALSMSWGAKAWENMAMGDTVKYVGSDPSSEVMSSPVELAGGSKPIEPISTGEARAQINDIFLKALPARPLPSPPKSGAASPIPRRLITGLPVEIVMKVDQGVQVDSDPHTPTSAITDVGDKTITASEREELKDALALLEVYKKRLEETEIKLEALQLQHADSCEVQYASRAVETVPETTLSTNELMPPICTSDATSTCDHSHSETCEAAHETPSDVEDKLQVSEVGDWRNYVRAPEWDPLERGVPTYVLMVGVGVCVVVLSSIVKRFVARKA